MTTVVIGLLPACFTVRDGGQEFGPEQFQFTVVEVNQAGPDADRVVSEFQGAPGDQLVPGSAVLVGRVETPMGQVRLVSYQTQGEMGLADCWAEVGETSSSAGCGSGGQDPNQPDSPITLTGVSGSNEWAHTSFEVADDVFEVVAVAADGTTYRITPAGGIGYVMWKGDHGSLNMTALDAAGEILGQATLEAPGP